MVEEKRKSLGVSRLSRPSSWSLQYWLTEKKETFGLSRHGSGHCQAPQPTLKRQLGNLTKNMGHLYFLPVPNTGGGGREYGGLEKTSEVRTWSISPELSSEQPPTRRGKGEDKLWSRLGKLFQERRRSVHSQTSFAEVGISRISNTSRLSSIDQSPVRWELI